MNKVAVNPEVKTSLNRRSFLQRAGIGAAAAMLPAGMLALTSQNASAVPLPPGLDAEILNFALNLEYLEAQYYLYGVTGSGLPSGDTTGTATTGPTTIKNSPQVTFSDATVQSRMEEVAQDEMNHVLFLRAALGQYAVSIPAIDLLNSFTTLANAANANYGSDVLPSPFDPYADQLSFLLGGFIFEDVGVTAYHGAAPFVVGRNYVTAATGILAVEAYHASTFRNLLYEMDQANPVLNIAAQVDAISALRATLSAAQDDQGIVFDGDANIVPTDANGLAFSRTPRQVLNVVYGGVGATAGLFFPNGINLIALARLLAATK